MAGSFSYAIKCQNEGGDVSGTQNYVLAEEDYMAGMKYKDIAAKYSVTINTVKSWKVRYGWNKKGVHTKPQKVCTQKTVALDAAGARLGIAKEDIDHVVSNPDLTDKQRLFCLCYVRCFNATKAYQKAYGCSYDVANAEGYKLLVKPCIKDEIHRLKQSRLNREMLDEHDIFQKYMDIAFADITDYVEFGREEVPAMGAFGPISVKDPETGEDVPLKKTVNTVRFKESCEVDGTLIVEVKQGRDGASVKLADRMKALDWLANHMNLATEGERAMIAQRKAQTQKITGEGMEVEDMSGIEAEIYGETDQEKADA